MSRENSLEVHVGHDELIIRRRYQALSIANDVLIALWFIAGSILFFSESTATAAIWLFLLGSVELLLRPAVRLARLIHLRRISSGDPDAEDDY